MLTKEQQDIVEAKHIKLLVKIDVFILITLVVTFITYYQAVSMFDLSNEIAIHVSIITGLIFAGFVFLSMRQHRDKESR